MGTRELMAERKNPRRAGAARPTVTPTVPAPQSAGPGSCLKEVLQLASFGAGHGCRCHDHARQMDQHGPEWCRRNIPLIRNWLLEEKRRQGLTVLGCVRRVVWCLVKQTAAAVKRWYLTLDDLVFALFARALIRYAIWRSRHS